MLLLFLLLMEKQRFIYWVPFLLQLADISKILITGGPAAPASILMDFTIIIASTGVALLVVLSNIIQLKKYAAGVFILLIYLLIMIFFSTDLWWSFKRYLNVALAFLLFPAAFIVTKGLEDIKRIVKPAICLVIIFLANVAVSTYLKLEIEQEGLGYGRSMVYLGSVNFYSIYGFVYALIIIPLAYYLTRKIYIKYLLIALYFAGLFVLILILKRAYVYLSLAGVLMFILFITKRKSLRFIGPFFIFGFIGYILTSDYILASYAIREDVIRRGYAEEGRGIELILYPEVVKDAKNPTTFMLYGEELFNSQGKFLFIEKMLNDKDRLLHSDIATIIYGAGIIGMFLFIRLYYFILRRFLKIRSRLRTMDSADILNKLYATYLSLFICLAANALSDGILIANNRAIPYLLMGAILGLFFKKVNPVTGYNKT